jgi:chromate reductase
MTDLTIGYIVGSLSSTSINRRLAKALERLAPEGVTLVEIPIADLPFYSVDLEADFPQAARDFKDAIDRVDGVIIVTPEYSRSIPGVLKNALDWASRPAGKSALNGTPAAAIGASTGMFGAVWAQAETRKVLGALGGRVIETELPVARADRLLVDGHLELDPQQSEQLEEILAELVASAEEAEEFSRERVAA